MAVQDSVVRERLADVFARQDFYEGCRRRDLGALIAILGTHGITQGQISAMTGIAQSRLSQYKTGKHQGSFASIFQKFADGLEMPDELRRALQGDASTATAAASPAGMVPADTFDLQLLAEAVGRNGSAVKRRDIFSMAAQLGTAAALARSEVWERLASALTDQTALNEAIVREMETRTLGFHRLEVVVGAPTLLRGLTAHMREVATLLGSTSSDTKDELRRRLLIVAGESSVIAGWAASDIGDAVAGRNLYDTAIKAANEAGDPAISACALAYRSYIPSTRGANGRARALLTEALEIVPRTSPATIAWIAARHAEESARLGDKQQALRSWATAEEAYNICDPDEDRVWTRFLDQNRFESFRIATYAKLGKLDEAQRVAEMVISRLSPSDGKKAVVILADIAAEHLARGSVNDAAKIGKNGLTILRETSFNMWLPHFEAISQTLKQFQRHPAVRAYLEELSITRRQLMSRL